VTAGVYCAFKQREQHRKKIVGKAQPRLGSKGAGTTTEKPGCGQPGLLGPLGQGVAPAVP
jgi:hypothetical protein